MRLIKGLWHDIMSAHVHAAAAWHIMPCMLFSALSHTMSFTSQIDAGCWLLVQTSRANWCGCKQWMRVSFDNLLASRTAGVPHNTRIMHVRWT